MCKMLCTKTCGQKIICTAVTLDCQKRVYISVLIHIKVIWEKPSYTLPLIQGKNDGCSVKNVNLELLKNHRKYCYEILYFKTADHNAMMHLYLNG